MCVCSESKLKVRGDWLFCWYWLNCWPSLFKLLPFMIWRIDRKKTRLEIISFWCIFQNNYMFVLVSYCMSHVEFCFVFCCFLLFFFSPLQYNRLFWYGKFLLVFCIWKQNFLNLNHNKIPIILSFRLILLFI